MNILYLGSIQDIYFILSFGAKLLYDEKVLETLCVIDGRVYAQIDNDENELKKFFHYVHPEIPIDSITNLTMKHLHPHSERIAYLQKQIAIEESYLQQLQTEKADIVESIQNPKTKFGDLRGLGIQARDRDAKIKASKNKLATIKKEVERLQNSNG